MTQSAKVTAPSRTSGNLVPIITMFFLFAMISFVTNLAAPIGTIWKTNFSWAGMLGNLMNFAAYLFMGIPAGRMLSNIGYRKTALWALAVGFIGLTCQFLSSQIGTAQDIAPLVIYLCGAFICGFSVCMLNTVVNPMLNLLGGGGNRGNQLVQTGGSLNSLAATLTPFVVGMLVGQITAETSMVDVSPLLVIGMAIFLISFIVLYNLKFQEPGSHVKSNKKDKYSPWNFRHTVLGVIGIFFYVGIEVGIPAVLIFYISDPAASGIQENGVAIGTAVAAVYWLLMLVGRFVSSLISGKVSSRVQLTVVSIVGAVLIILAICLGNSSQMMVPAYSVEEGFSMAQVPIAALFLVLCGLCTSVMWGGIFNLAVEGLGKYTAKASGIFMMMVVGGGIVPWIQEMIATNVGYMASYWIPFGIMCYLLFYALVGSKNVNTNIPTEEEYLEEQEVPDTV